MTNDQFFKNSFLFGANAGYLEELYEKYLQDKSSVDKDWQDTFAGLGESSISGAIQAIQTHNNFNKITAQKFIANANPSSSQTCLELQARMLRQAYRDHGHFLAKIDPLELEILPQASSVRLDLKSFDIDEQGLDTAINLDDKTTNIHELFTRLNKIYATNIGYEFAHINNKEQVEWLTDRIENYDYKNELTPEQRKDTLKSLIEIESFEQFLQTKFPSAKRFSVEGGDNSIVATNWAIKTAACDGVSEVVVGMAHRGRLNSLAKILHKPYVAIFSEFQGGLPFPKDLGLTGDVKYHEGYSTDAIIEGKEMHLTMLPNPSHLEAINPVLAGNVRAKQNVLKDKKRHKVMGVLLHGDASFCGQGVVAESLMLSDLDGYSVGGIVHIIVNNQVGFTAVAKNGRASRYPTEVAKIIEAPIFHVNGNCTEDVVKVSRIATQYRNRFGRDVVINLVCYRLYGHNEMDEPRFTQPQMYNKIESLETPGKTYANELLAEKVIDDKYFAKHKETVKEQFEKDLEAAKTYKPVRAEWFGGVWAKFSQYKTGKSTDKPTGVKLTTIKEIGLRLSDVPKEFAVNARISRQLEARKQMIATGNDINWATAEALAFGSLLLEGVGVRLSGQDSSRGTFSHRHSMLVDQQNGSLYTPLNNLAKNQASYEVIDSCLSEYAVMGFEYGYSAANPNNLVMWEGQYGDFVNGAQIVIDQFIVSAETKWLRSSGLVLLLPHAYEGEGPEHTSARLERFLQLCAQDNIQVVNCSTPVSYFHALRRQICRDYRKPLIVMTPKSLLRHKLAVSKLDEFAIGTEFTPVIADTIVNPKRAIFCSGKIYYDLLEYREANKIRNVALVRLEQLYPIPKEQLLQQLLKYQNAEIVWCQEEPENMGAWRFLRPFINDLLAGLKIKSQVKYIGREEYASTADGYNSIHRLIQENIIKQVFNLL